MPEKQGSGQAGPPSAARRSLGSSWLAHSSRARGMRSLIDDARASKNLPRTIAQRFSPLQNATAPKVYAIFKCPGREFTSFRKKWVSRTISQLNPRLNNDISSCAMMTLRNKSRYSSNILLGENCGVCTSGAWGIRFSRKNSRFNTDA